MKATCTFAVIIFSMLLPLSIPAQNFKENYYQQYLLEEQLLLLEENFIIVTATRTKEPIKNIPASVTVITKEDIEKKRVIAIDELLRDVPGLHIARFGTIGEESFPRMRGADRRHIVVMLDGVILNPYDDSFDFADYHVDNIERIEIIRGSYSALYGSDAMGGVINIITKKPEPYPKYSVSAEGGNFYTYRELISANTGTDKLRLVLSGSRTDSEGNFERDEYENNTLSANLQYDFSNDSNLNLISRYIASKKEIAVGVAAPVTTLLPRVIFDQNWRTNRKTFVNSLSYKNEASTFWDFSLTGSYFYFHDIEDDETEPSMPTLSFLQSNVKSTRSTLETQHNFHPHKNDTITAGIALEREAVDFIRNINLTLGGLFPANETFKKHRTNLGIYLQNVYNWEDRWILIAGGRFDHYDTFGSIINPKISSSYLITPTQTKLKANYGFGYHAPSFDQLFGIPMGNTDLEPEKSKSFEIGADQFIADNLIKVGITYFNINFTNLIIRDFSQFKYVNAEKARSRGVESYIKITPIKGLALNVNYTYTSTKNKTTGTQLGSIPKYMLNFNIDYDVTERFNVNMDMHFVGSEFVSAGDVVGLDGSPVGNENPSYKKVDFTTSYILVKDCNFLKDLTLYCNVLNLLDEKYSEIAAAPSPGINFRVGLEASF